jgi:hypothetical protein
MGERQASPLRRLAGERVQPTLSIGREHEAPLEQRPEDLMSLDRRVFRCHPPPNCPPWPESWPGALYHVP